MPDQMLTVADHVADALDLSPAEVSDVVESASFPMRLPFTESSNGSVHKYAKKTGAPTVGFRLENEGREFGKSAYETVLLQLAILDYSWAVDVAVAKGSPKGEETVIAREGLDHIMAAMFVMERQFFQGKANGDAQGFDGFPEALNAIGGMVINGGGTTANECTSVYLMKLGENDVSGVMPTGDDMGLGERIVQNFKDDSGKNLPKYYTPASTWAGIQIGGKYSVARLANIDSTPAGSLTDDKIIDAIEAFPMGQPDLIVMNRTARKQLRSSRTATNATGAPAPIPANVEGIPILKTEALTDNEAVVA